MRAKYRDDMTDEQVREFLAEVATLDEAYADADKAGEAARLAFTQDEMDELETEADLYRYWR